MQIFDDNKNQKFHRGKHVTLGVGLQVSEDDTGLPILTAHSGEIIGMVMSGGHPTTPESITLFATADIPYEFYLQPVSKTDYLSLNRVKFDSTGYNAARVVLNVINSGSADSYGYLEYASADAGPWETAGDPLPIRRSLVIPGCEAGASQFLNSSAIDDVFWRVVFSGGDGVESPSIGLCAIQFLWEPECTWATDLLGGTNIFANAGAWTEETSLGIYGCINPTTGLPYNDGNDYCVGPVGWTAISGTGSSAQLDISGFILFNWNDDHQGGSPYGNPFNRDVWRTRTFTGLPPGKRVGITCDIVVNLNTNADWKPFMRIIGDSTEEWSGHLYDVTFWNVGGGGYEPTIRGLFLSTTVPANGVVTLQFGVNNLHPSGNINIHFINVQFAQCAA